MVNSSVKSEIARAIQSLSLTPNEIQLLEEEKSREIFKKCADRFLNSQNSRWWWEDFKETSFSIPDLERPFEHLDEYIPHGEKKVWLMVQDDEDDFYPIYDCQADIIGPLIGECFAFEYYIIGKNLSWLLCENHHSILIGTGDFGT